MIGKAESIAHTAIAIEYARSKKKAQEIHRNGVGEQKGEDIAKEFAQTQQLKPDCNKHTLSIILSPTVKDGQEMSLMDFREINDDFLKRMGLDSRQSVSYLHNDAAHRHLHIYVNRIDVNGEPYPDSFVGAKTGKIAREIAEERGMTIGNVAKRELKEAQMLEMKEDIDVVLKSKPNSVDELNERLLKQGIQLKEHKDREGNLRGHRFERVGESGAVFKASKVAPDLTPNKMMFTLSRIARGAQIENENSYQNQHSI